MSAAEKILAAKNAENAKKWKAVGEPGCVSPRKNLTRRCGGAEDVREVIIW